MNGSLAVNTCVLECAVYICIRMYVYVYIRYGQRMQRGHHVDPGKEENTCILRIVVIIIIIIIFISSSSYYLAHRTKVKDTLTSLFFLSQSTSNNAPLAPML